MATLKDLALYLNTTPSTVSRALHGHPRISQKRREQVLKAAEELGYSGNKLASGLKNQKTGLIGVVVPDMSVPFFSKVVSGLQDYFYDAGYEILVGQSLESAEREAEIINRFLKYNVEGLAISCSKETSEILTRNRRLSNIPFVVFDRISDERQINKIIVDDHAGAYQATQVLIGLGCRNLYCITGPDTMSNCESRKHGFLDAINDSKGSIDFTILYSNLAGEENEHKIREALCDPSIDGLFGASDSITNQMLEILEDEERKIRLAGFIDDHYLGPAENSIIKIHQPSFEIGLTTARHLLKLIQKAKASFTELLKPEVVIGRHLMVELS